MKMKIGWGAMVQALNLGKHFFWENPHAASSATETGYQSYITCISQEDVTNFKRFSIHHLRC
jgi:hypothetical protein